MSDIESTKKIIKTLTAIIEKQRDPTDDCMAKCAGAYDDCVGKATSDAELAACTVRYNNCVSNC